MDFGVHPADSGEPSGVLVTGKCNPLGCRGWPVKRPEKGRNARMRKPRWKMWGRKERAAASCQLSLYHLCTLCLSPAAFLHSTSVCSLSTLRSQSSFLTTPLPFRVFGRAVPRTQCPPSYFCFLLLVLSFHSWSLVILSLSKDPTQSMHNSSPY